MAYQKKVQMATTNLNVRVLEAQFVRARRRRQVRSWLIQQPCLIDAGNA
jgi:hypothetical protein